MAKDKEYIVKSLSVGGLNNQIFHSRDKVKASNFAPGVAEQLVKDGALMLGKKSSEKEVITLIEKAKTVNEVNVIVEGEDRDKVKEAADKKVEELQAEIAEAVEVKSLEAIKELEKVDQLKTYQAEGNSKKVIKAATAKIDEMHIEAISKITNVADLASYKGESFSEDVNTAAELRTEELNGADADAKKEADAKAEKDLIEGLAKLDVIQDLEAYKNEEKYSKAVGEAADKRISELEEAAKKQKEEEDKVAAEKLEAAEKADLETISKAKKVDDLKAFQDAEKYSEKVVNAATEKIAEIEK